MPGKPLKILPQGQLTLIRATWIEMGQPPHIGTAENAAAVAKRNHQRANVAPRALGASAQSPRPSSAVARVAPNIHQRSRPKAFATGWSKAPTAVAGCTPLKTALSDRWHQVCSARDGAPFGWRISPRRRPHQQHRRHLRRVYARLPRRLPALRRAAPIALPRRVRVSLQRSHRTWRKPCHARGGGAPWHRRQAPHLSAGEA
jgi:hypothetical protein